MGQSFSTAREATFLKKIADLEMLEGSTNPAKLGVCLVLYHYVPCGISTLPLRDLRRQAPNIGEFYPDFVDACF